MNKSFSNMNVLITGASGSIGSAIAERFAEAGMNVIIHYLRSHEAANETARKCMSHNVKVLTCSADLKSKEQLARMKDDWCNV
jgi:3-oxoacyl-[acyl-carrier protein] reductase